MIDAMFIKYKKNKSLNLVLFRPAEQFLLALTVHLWHLVIQKKIIHTNVINVHH